MSVTPRPDRDKIDFPESRYPLSYCMVCGAGFLEYLRCTQKVCDFTGEVMPNGKPAIVPANAANVPGFDWSKVKPAETEPAPVDPFASLKPPK